MKVLKTVVLNPYDSNQISLIEKSNYQSSLQKFTNVPKFYTEEKYKSLKTRSNSLFDCLLLVEGDGIKNYCIFTGTKDNRLVQLQFANLESKEFIEKSETYAFSFLDAHTITIFSDDSSTNLEKLGFENLGEDGGITTYIKEEKELEMERIRR